MPTDLQKFDEICMSFEKAWSPSMDLSSVFSFILENIEKIADRSSLVAEICVTDLERQWQNWAERDLSLCSTSEAIKDFEKLPRTSDYQSAMVAKSFDSLSRTGLQELKVAEMKARQKYGDLPCPSDFSVELREKELLNIKRPTVLIRSRGETLFQTQTWGDFNVGRQAKGEPNPPAFFQLGEVDKLIVAAGQDGSISRGQAHVMLLSRQFCLVTNTSSNRAFLLNDEIESNPGSSTIARLPLVIDLNSIQITLQRKY